MGTTINKNDVLARNEEGMRSGEEKKATKHPRPCLAYVLLHNSYRKYCTLIQISLYLQYKSQNAEYIQLMKGVQPLHNPVSELGL